MKINAKKYLKQTMLKTYTKKTPPPTPKKTKMIPPIHPIQELVKLAAMIFKSIASQ